MFNHPIKRVLYIGDIHGNKERLERLLASSAYAAVDHRVFAGDYVDGCGDIVGTAQLMLEEAKRSDVTVLKANHERDLVVFLKQFLAFQLGKAPSPKLPGKKERLATLEQLHQYWESTRDHTMDGHDPFHQLVLGIINLYHSSPYFVRIGRAFFAHGGFHPAMMRSLRHADRIQMVRGVYTADLRDVEAPHVMLGNMLVRKARHGNALQRAPEGFSVYVGHHYGRSNTETPWTKNGITCLDTGCGKSDDNLLTAAEINAETGELIALHTF
ncbi:MAG: hypothetical protein GC134_05350 [Proteobacteria bacterium]|nr:hypothetical protein [Pseudomonadota bacterium]